MKHGVKRCTQVKNKVYDIGSYVFSHREKILIDANIWLYLYPAPVNSKKNVFNVYSKAFSRMLSRGAAPILDPLILSEYLNRYCRIEYDANYKNTYSTYKNWRQSKDFQRVSLSAKNFARGIIKICTIHSFPPSSLNMVQITKEFAAGEVDFNDALFIDICLQNKIKFMTNDADFRNGGIEILTANPNLLANHT